ncbi:ankyrin [Athelia psychrophila]|uniref:Ankyrin n=1 Tax=Athelia psychrophila TaxID=1759441 RepID=A0A166G6V6_9AGAM|nr:ankyrin [Fibularhizoctonia sp. CBS 109695]
MLRFLVEHGADVNMLDKHGATALHIVSQSLYGNNYGPDTVVQFLVEHGADVNIQDKDGATVLHIASQRFHRNHNFDAMVRFLVTHGADVNFLGKDRAAALHIAAEQGEAAMVEYLFDDDTDDDTDVIMQGELGMTARKYIILTIDMSPLTD